LCRKVCSPPPKSGSNPGLPVFQKPALYVFLVRKFYRAIKATKRFEFRFSLISVNLALSSNPRGFLKELLTTQPSQKSSLRKDRSVKEHPKAPATVVVVITVVVVVGFEAPVTLPVTYGKLR